MSKKLTDPCKIALNFIKYRFRSELEVVQKLKRKKISPQKIKEVIRKLKKEGAINDEQFARAWVRSRINLKPSGQRLIFWELVKKGIDKEKAKEVLAQELPEELEEDQAKDEAQKRWLRLKGLPPAQKKQKIYSFLARRGFSYQISQKVISDLFRD